MKVELGQVVATPGALHALRSAGHSPGDFLSRHVGGDWGNLDGHDHKQNQIALREGGRLLSSHMIRTDVKVWSFTGIRPASRCGFWQTLGPAGR